ncbi:MAG: cytochrome c biogenesis protein CcsA [Holophagaceae bacterium]|nr:cytochrome c biogenesis protein CcsA [Holophagaceae bacterium]
MLGLTSLSALALILYMAAEAFSLAHLRREKDSFATATTVLLLLGFLVHFAALEIGGRAVHSVPYRDLSSSMSLFAWMIAASYGILLLRHRESSTGPFLIPLAIFFLLISLITHPGPAIVSDPKRSGSLFAMHVTLAIFGYAALTLAFVLAQLYLIQNQQLRRRKLGPLFSKLPALDVLSRLHQTSVVTGVSALTVATVLGLIWAKSHWGTYWDPKVLFTFLIIGLYMFTLFPGRAGGGKKNAILSIAGFFLLLFSYSIVNLFITQEHMFQ